MNLRCLSKQSNVLTIHLQMIIETCVELDPELIAIALYGSYGREEGGWYEAEDGSWKPYNDYDIQIISCSKIPSEKLKYAAKQLAKKIDINWIDMGQMHPNLMRLLTASILNYDYKYGSKIIYGDPTILDVIPEIDSKKLPTEEVLILFFTRLYTLIGSFEKYGLSAKMGVESIRFFRNQMAKAVLAIVDVLLLVKGNYDASYNIRVSRVTDLYPDKVEFVKLSHWALKEKLNPQAPPMCPEEVSDLYKTVHRHFFNEMYTGLSTHFGKPINSPEDIEFCMKWTPLSIAKRIWWTGRFWGLRMERQLAIQLAQSYIAAAWSANSISEPWLTRGIDLLGFADGRVVQYMEWDDARLEAARLRMGM